MQVYAATLAELVRDVTERRGTKSALISRTTRPGNLRLRRRVAL